MKLKLLSWNEKTGWQVEKIESEELGRRQIWCVSKKPNWKT